MSEKKKQENKMPFYDYINLLNEKNVDINLNGGVFPEISTAKMEKKALKHLIFNNIYFKLMNILMKMYKWEVPDYLDARAIELGYINAGAVCACEIGGLGKYVLPCIATNSYNVYGNPTSVRVKGYNTFSRVVKIDYGDIEGNNLTPDPIVKNVEKDVGVGVYSRDNDMGYPYVNYVKEYALKLSDALIAKQIAFQRLKNPFVYVADEIDIKDSFEKMVEKIESNDDVIFRIKNGSKLQGREEPIQMTPNQMKPEVLVAMQNSINFDFNMFLETVGLNTNPSPDKSQVVLTPEIESNDQFVKLEDDVRLTHRKKLCEDAKRVGIEMSVISTPEEAQKEADKMKKELQGGIGDGDNEGVKGKTGQGISKSDNE